GQLKLSGTYATLTDLETAFPNGAEGLYLVTADGFTYRWDGSAWIRAAQFQSSGIADGSVTPEKTNFIIQSLNRLNKNSNDIMYGKIVNGYGEIVDFAAGFLSHKIPAKSGDTFIITFDTGFNNTIGGFF